MMADSSDALDQLRQHQMITQQAAHLRPLNIGPPSSTDLFAASAQKLNGSLSKIMADDDAQHLVNISNY